MEDLLHHRLVQMRGAGRLAAMLSLLSWAQQAVSDESAAASLHMLEKLIEVSLS